jgi:alanyl-tRNA synthetase
MITTNEIVKRMTEYFAKRGYPLEKPTGLISPVFPGTFNPSAAHGEVMEMIGQDTAIDTSRKFFVVEKCFRHVDLDKVGRSHHSAFFQMSAYVFGASVTQLPRTRKQIIEEAYNFLTQELGLNPKRFLVTIFGGGKVKNLEFEPDNESFEVWKELGILEDKLIMVPGENNFVYLQREGDAAGPRCEIYYDRGENYTENRYVEIGSVIFEIYYFSKGQLRDSKNVVAGGAFGIERLAMVLNNLHSIYEVDTFAPLVDIVKNHITDNRIAILFSDKLYTFVDFLRSIVFIISAGQLPDKSKRGEILKKLIRVMASEARFFGIKNKKIYEELVDKTIELYKKQYPDLKNNRHNILNIINERI